MRGKDKLLIRDHAKPRPAAGALGNPHLAPLPRFRCLKEHDLFGKPAFAFPDHALERRLSKTKAHTDARQSHDFPAPTDEAGGKEKRRPCRLGLSDRADRRPRRIRFISVGDSVGVNLWGRSDVLDVTLDEMLICCKAVRRGVERALVSCDMPYGPVQQNIDSALADASRLVAEGGADMIKIDAAADHPNVVRALVDAGIPVFTQFGLTPQTSSKHGIAYSAQNSPAAQASAGSTATLVAQAKLLEQSGACLLDFTNSGPVAGAAVVEAVKIPVIGGFGGGPWFDGRVRCAYRDRLCREVARCADRNLRQHRQSRIRRLRRPDCRCSRVARSKVRRSIPSVAVEEFDRHALRAAHETDAHAWPDGGRFAGKLDALLLQIDRDRVDAADR